MRLAPAMLLAGVAAAVGTVAVHQWWWGLLLGGAATVSLLVATPPGWGTRLPMVLGFCGTVALTAVPRGEGDYLVASTARGYAVLGLALLALTFGIATLPRPGSATDRRPSDAKAPQE